MKQKIENRNIGPVNIEMRVAPETVNEQERTVEVVFTTGARGLRTPWWGDPYYEELVVDDSALRLDRANNKMPFMRDHAVHAGIDAVIGVVVRAWIDNGIGKALIRFSKGEDGERYFQEVLDGVLCKISMTYRVYKYEIIEPEEDEKYSTYRAVDWEPIEFSLVNIAFDDLAQTRSAANENNRYNCQFLSPEESMGKKNNNDIQSPTQSVVNRAGSEAGDGAGTDAGATPGTVTLAEVNTDAVRAEGAEAERRRINLINTAVRSCGLGDEFAASCIERGLEMDKVYDEIQDKLAERQAEVHTPHVEILTDERDSQRSLIESAILHRFNPASFELLDGANVYRGLSMIEIGRRVLGSSTDGMSAFEVAQRLLTTSDFPLIAGNVAQKILLTGYEVVGKAFDPIVTYEELHDFKEIDLLKFESASELDELKEGQNYKLGKFNERSEKMAIKKAGKKFLLSEELIVNDDRRVFTRMPFKAGQLAMVHENKKVFGVLTGNPKMSDGKTLFHADHGNLAASGGAPSEATFSAGRKAMTSQKEGQLPILLSPEYVVCGPAKEGDVRKYLSSEVIPTKSADARTMRNLKPIVTPIITDNSYFLTVNPKMGAETIVVGYLAGQTGPVMESYVDRDKDGVVFKVKHYVEAKAADWKTMYKDPGA